ncbi:MAG: hypothetical protein K9J51_04825 [Desulfotignum sp.]|nr:hypothetical protein [Desulfotignum sp.]
MKKPVQKHLSPDNQDSVRLQAVLLEIFEALSYTRTLAELYNAIHDSLKKFFNMGNFYIALYHPAGPSISFPFYVDKNDRIPDEITNQVIKAGKSIIFREQNIDDNTRQQTPQNSGSVDKIWLAAPLMVGNNRIGVIWGAFPFSCISKVTEIV